MLRSSDAVRRITDLIYTGFAAVQASPAARWAPLPLRLITGYGFAQHGFAKLLRGAGDFTLLLHAMGLPMPVLFAWLTIVTEASYVLAERPFAHTANAIRSAAASANQVMAYCMCSSRRCGDSGPGFGMPLSGTGASRST
jgi:hypothetical protein